MRVMILFLTLLSVSSNAFSDEVTPSSPTTKGFWTKAVQNSIVVVNERWDTTETNQILYLAPDSIKFGCLQSNGIYFLFGGQITWIGCEALTNDPTESAVWPLVLETARQGAYTSLYQAVSDLIEGNAGEKMVCVTNQLVYRLRYNVPNPDWNFPSSPYGVWWCLVQAARPPLNSREIERVFEELGRGKYHPLYQPCRFLLN